MWASAASMKLPVKLISRARRMPIACGSSTDSPQLGITPTRAWVSPNFARSDATRKSQLSASSKPPVTAAPLTAPTSGLVIVPNGPRASRDDTDVPAASSSLELSASCWRSRPEQNAGSAPVRIITSTSPSCSARSIDSPSSSSASGLSGVANVGSVERDGGDALGDPVENGRRGHQSVVSSAGKKANRRSPRRTSVAATQPPSTPKCSSSTDDVPSASVSSANSYRPS